MSYLDTTVKPPDRVLDLLTGNQDQALQVVKKLLPASSSGGSGNEVSVRWSH
jgi:hypothetical protein